jgi:hypothetical protein
MEIEAYSLDFRLKFLAFLSSTAIVEVRSQTQVLALQNLLDLQQSLPGVLPNYASLQSILKVLIEATFAVLDPNATTTTTLGKKTSVKACRDLDS